jgi:ParB/RepB/Spo0J family partition protein
MDQSCISWIDVTRHCARSSAWRRLLASLAEVGQQMPIIVVREGARWIVVDGYKRVRAVHRLGRDVVLAAEWLLSELDALVLERAMRGGDADSAIEQGWLLRELVQRFGLGLDELARRFDRSPSWVSRRLGLVTDLPAAVQEQVRAGALGAHAAMKYLVPLARANAPDCEALVQALGALRPTSRQIAELYAAYTAGNAAVRERLVQQPALVLKARADLARAGGELSAAEHLLHDLRVVAAIARRLGAGSAKERWTERASTSALALASTATGPLRDRASARALRPGDDEDNHAGSDDTDTILRLREEGHGTRAIARALGVSRGSVKQVLAAGTALVPRLVRAERGEPHRDQIVELYTTTKGNLVRVHEELMARGVELSYSALTAFCRRHDIGYEPPPPAGRYDFEPGSEMQHDTSPHQALVAGHRAAVQTAALVLGHSRMRFQLPRFASSAGLPDRSLQC